jgi:chromosome partitioning protein
MFHLSADQDIFGLALKRIRPLEVDVVLLDCPPGLGIVSAQAIISSDRVLMPTLCEPASLKGLSEAIDLIRGEGNKPIDVLRSRYRSRLVLTREADDMLIEGAEDLGFRLLHTVIPENIQVAESIAAQKPVTEYAPNSSGAKAYKSAAKELQKIWGIK